MTRPGSLRPRSKAEWRREILAERKQLSTGQRDDEASALAEAVVALPLAARGNTICAYAPVGFEPGSMAMLDALRECGVRVLLPVVPRRPGRLGWACYDGVSGLVTATKLRLREPVGRRLVAEVIREAAAVLVPAVAVDYEGIRLGRGGGYYDRSLRLAAPDTALIAVVRDGEVVPRLPAEPHDVRMTATLTPAGGFVPLPR